MPSHHATQAANILRQQLGKHADRLSLQWGVVAAVTPPTVKITPLASDTANDEDYAYLRGASPAVGDNVVYGMLGTAWVVLGVIASATTVTSFALSVNVGDGKANIVVNDLNQGVVVNPCTLVGWQLLGDVAGSVTVSVRRCTYAAYPPVAGNEILSLSLASATKANGTVTPGTITLAKGDVIRAVTTAVVTGLKQYSLTLDVQLV